MRVVVFGATGRTGRRVTKRALDNGYHVTGVVRTPSKLDFHHERLSIVQGNVTNYDSFVDALQDQDAVVSTIGKETYLSSVTLYSEGTKNIIRAMNEHGVTRLIAISSGGTHPGLDRKNGLFYELIFKRILLRGVYSDMKRMEDIIMKSNLDWTIVRPSGLTGDEESGEYRVENGYSIPESSTTTRGDMAEFIVKDLESGEFVQEGVAVVSV